MIRSLILFLILTHAAGSSATHSLPVVQAGGLLLVGDPQTLDTLEKLSIGKHAMTFHRWKINAPLEQVMRTLSTQVASDTIAWHDGDVMRMVWTSADQSRMLSFIATDENHIEFVLSSMHLTNKGTIQAMRGPLFSKGLQASSDIHVALNKFLHQPPTNAEILMDVEDDSGGAGANSALYGLSISLDRLEETLQTFFKKYHWSVHTTQYGSDGLNQKRSLTAVHAGNLLHMDLVQYLGRSYLHVNFSGVMQP